MTGRERLQIVSRGGEADQRPVVCWPKSVGGDALIVENLIDLQESVGSDQAVLFKTENPFGKALLAGINLNDAHEQSPEQGTLLLSKFVDEIVNEAQTAMDAGADGLFYVLQGAQGSFCTPMQYGGHYLETDREILAQFSEANINVVFACGNDDLYIDFVSDLPAHIFAWDSEASTFDNTYVRTLRKGALASSDPLSDVLLNTGVVSVADFLKKEKIYA